MSNTSWNSIYQCSIVCMQLWTSVSFTFQLQLFSPQVANATIQYLDIVGSCLSIDTLFRAIAAGLVSLVSTGPLFPPLVACLALPISAIARRTPTQCPKAHRYHVETCEMAANSATKLFRKSSFQQLSVLTIGQLGFICEGWRFRPISGLRSNLIAPKFQNFYGGAGPP